MTLRTRFTDLFGLGTPIAQAGMAFVGMTPDLAIAVSNAGALGSLGVGLMPAPAITATIDAIRAGTRNPFHVNLITPMTTQDQVEAVVAARPAAVSFHWGHPQVAWISSFHAAGIKVIEQVGAVEAARRAVGDGVDVIVAQGSEAGGHNFATLPTFALVPLVVDAAGPALVLASGGIADGRGLAAALALGADGAWIGTRFVATPESAARNGYKERLVTFSATETSLTSAFGPEMPAFNPMRVLRNRAVTDPAPGDSAMIGETVLGGQTVELRRFTNFVPITTTTGDLEEMPLLSGQGVGLITTIEPAAAIIDRITADASKILHSF